MTTLTAVFLTLIAILSRDIRELHGNVSDDAWREISQ